MISKIKKLIKQRIIEPTSIAAVNQVVNADKSLKEIWDYSFEQFPDFGRHFTVPVDNKEIESRIRLLVVAETAFIRNVLKELGSCSYADIGDADGSVRLLLRKYFSDEQVKSTGVNLQESAVKKMREQGLDAICEDALSLKDKGVIYDVVSLFETLEHLPDPIGFLKGIRGIVNHKLVISVPYIRNSRIGLNYLTDRWPEGKRPTIENTHIFELSPGDWKKIFRHAGWKIDHEQKLLMFPQNRPSRMILQPYWRYESFEGFWFVSLSQCDKDSSRYLIE